VTSPQNESQTRLSELTNSIPTRYLKISDYFKKRDTLDLSLAEELRRLAADMEEIMILKGQKEFINTIFSTIIRAFKDPKLKNRLTKGQESYIYDVLVKVDNGKYMMNECYSRSLGITGNLPEENTIQFRQVQEAYTTLKKVTNTPNNFTRDQLKKISEMTIDNKDEVVTMCQNYKIAVFDSDVSQSSLWESNNDKYTQQIHTDTSDSRPNKIQEFWVMFGKLCFEIAKDCESFPPQILEREQEIASALWTYAEFFIPGKDMKYKRHWCDWFEIGKKVDETSINNAANKSPAFANMCPKCVEPNLYQDPTGTKGLMKPVKMNVRIVGEDPKDNHIKWDWECPRCHGHEMAERTMTKERVGDMIPTVLEYATRMINHLPMACEFMDWFNEWRLPKITAQTIALSPKLEEKC
jgi:hypothetical protein